MGNSTSSQQHQQRPPSTQNGPPPPLPGPYPYSPAPIYTQGAYAPGAYGGPGFNQASYGPAPYHQGPPPPGPYPPQQGGYMMPNPYAAPLPKADQYQRTATIRNQVNLKKPTLKLEKVSDSVYTLSFKFDASAPCRVTTFFMAHEDLRRGCKITTRHPTGPAIYFDKGLDQSFPPATGTSTAHSLDLTLHPAKELLAVSSAAAPAATSAEQSAAATQQTYAIIIRLEALTEEGAQLQRTLTSLEPGCEQPDWVQSQSTYVRITQEEGTGDLAVRIMKQKIWFKGDAYELQEIYGMERQKPTAVAMGTPATAQGVDALEDVDGNECVICMSAPRDTAALPCRHMCMCHSCAGALKTQTNKCPICRNEIKKLLHIKINKPPGEGASSDAAAPAPAGAANTPAHARAPAPVPIPTTAAPGGSFKKA